MARLPDQRPENLGGYIVHGIPFPIETDPEALAIGYFRNARKVDKTKYTNYADGQSCSNCAFVGFSSAMRKPCELIPGKLVNGGGWCAKWVKKV